MAKFNKDTFLNDITAKVQSAIDKNLITREDMQENELERLHGFIQYELLQYIEDRKFAIDVLKDFNYDEKVPWENLQTEYGTFKSLLDIALVNLWKFLNAEGATKFEYYNHNNKQDGTHLLCHVDEFCFYKILICHHSTMHRLEHKSQNAKECSNRKKHFQFFNLFGC